LDSPLNSHGAHYKFGPSAAKLWRGKIPEVIHVWSI